MLRAEHELIGGVIGIIFGLWLYLQGNILLAFGCFLIAIWGANLPDLLDPPTSPFHRSIGHNFISFILFIIISIIGLALSIIFSWWPFIMATAFSLAVLSHLILDMTTPAGLPMFVGKSFFGFFEIPLFLVPILNIVMLIISIIMALYTIRILAKKIGGIFAMILLFIPIWGATLLFGIALSTASGTLGGLWHLLGGILIFLFIVIILILALVGVSIDATVRASDKIIYKIKRKIRKIRNK